MATTVKMEHTLEGITGVGDKPLKVQQGTLPLNTSLGLSRDHTGRLVGIYFAKGNSFFSVAIALVGLIASFLLLIFMDIFTAVVIFILFAAMFLNSIGREKRKDESGGIKYSLDEIESIKILDDISMMANEKNAVGSLGGAAVGGALFGGTGAVVGAISSGNNLTKEQVVNLGIKLTDKNWVVVRFEINQTVLGKANKIVLENLLEATAKKQECPF